MRKYIELLICDRCKKEYETRGVETMALGVMYLQNGSGSRSNLTDRDLDKDLCSDCTGQFKRFWGNL